MDTKPYLDYLDKEMAIMGILCAISITAPAGVLGTIAGKESKLLSEIWSTGHLYITAGSIMCLVASLYFYKQRSFLAWHYGQICLAEAFSSENSKSNNIREWLRSADSWKTWWPYSWGFDFLLLGFFYYLTALFLLIHPQQTRPWQYGSGFDACALVLPLVIATSSAATQRYVLTTYKFSDDCWAAFRETIAKRIRTGSIMPHDGVYARLKPSALHGIGVFAIRHIPRGTYLFEPDDDRLISVPASATESLPQEIRRMYEDFCVLDGDSYQCPTSLNELTTSWYLNHSKAPNVAADLSLKFYAIRDIEPEEELTSDYRSYSDNESDGLVNPTG